MKRGELLERLSEAIHKAGKRGTTTEELAQQLDCNRQYIRKLIREKLGREVTVEGISSPTSAPIYRWKKKKK